MQPREVAVGKTGRQSTLLIRVWTCMYVSRNISRGISELDTRWARAERQLKVKLRTGDVAVPDAKMIGISAKNIINHAMHRIC